MECTKRNREKKEKVRRSRKGENKIYERILKFYNCLTLIRQCFDCLLINLSKLVANCTTTIFLI